VYKINFIPYIGSDPIKLGALRDEARKTLGAYKEFRKTKFSKNTTDDFSFCHIYYDDQDKVKAIEFFDSTEFLFMERNMFSFQFMELKSFLKSKSIDFQEDNSGLKSEAIGLSVYSPDKVKIETILIFKEGYYD